MNKIDEFKFERENHVMSLILLGGGAALSFAVASTAGIGVVATGLLCVAVSLIGYGACMVAGEYTKEKTMLREYFKKLNDFDTETLISALSSPSLSRDTKRAILKFLNDGSRATD